MESDSYQGAPLNDAPSTPVIRNTDSVEREGGWPLAACESDPYEQAILHCDDDEIGNRIPLTP